MVSRTSCHPSRTRDSGFARPRQNPDSSSLSLLGMTKESYRLLLQQFLNCRSNLCGIRCDRGFKTLDHVAVAVDQKLSEVPLDVPGVRRISVLGEVVIERRLISPFYGNLRVQR